MDDHLEAGLVELDALIGEARPGGFADLVLFLQLRAAAPWTSPGSPAAWVQRLRELATPWVDEELLAVVVGTAARLPIEPCDLEVVADPRTLGSLLEVGDLEAPLMFGRRVVRLLRS